VIDQAVAMHNAGPGYDDQSYLGRVFDAYQK
jgi:hypothetical protein